MAQHLKVSEWIQALRLARNNEAPRSGPDHEVLANQTFERLLADYSHPSRRYHNVDHVTAVVARVGTLGSHTLSEQGVAVVQLAAWYHDVVYDATRADNETLSAVRSVAELAGLGLSLETLGTVDALVRMTAHHRAQGPLQAVLADADLWTLGGPPEQYFAYGELIRSEYSHVQESAWRAGRGAFIVSFLERERIFHTERGRDEREAQARANLQAEFDGLTA